MNSVDLKLCGTRQLSLLLPFPGLFTRWLCLHPGNSMPLQQCEGDLSAITGNRVLRRVLRTSISVPGQGIVVTFDCVRCADYVAQSSVVFTTVLCMSASLALGDSALAFVSMV